MTTDATSPAATASPTLIGRPAAAGVITRCLLEQGAADPRNRLQRIFGVSPLYPEARSWYAGAIGELHVAKRLEALGPEFTVLHSVPVGKGESDIDHIVVGPSGVFTINTKHHAGARVWVGARKILVNGQSTDHLRKSRYEFKRAERLMRAALGADIPVCGALVIVGARDINIKQQPDIAVMTDDQLVRWLRKRPAAHLDATAVTQYATLPQTWHARGAEAIGADADLGAFAQLRNAVNRSTSVQQLWRVGLYLAAVGTLLAIAWPQLSMIFGW